MNGFSNTIQFPIFWHLIPFPGRSFYCTVQYSLLSTLFRTYRALLLIPMCKYAVMYYCQWRGNVVHCTNNTLNLRIKNKPVTAGADATVYSISGFCICTVQYRLKIQTYPVASSTNYACWVFMRRFRLFSGQCAYVDL